MQWGKGEMDSQEVWKEGIPSSHSSPRHPNASSKKFIFCMSRVLLLINWTVIPCVHSILVIILFIHSFRLFLLPITISSPLLLRGAPDTARTLCRNFMPKRHRQLWVKNLPKVPTWRLERESNPWPFGQKSSTLPKRHHVPQWCLGLNIRDQIIIIIILLVSYCFVMIFLL